ncbi:MAG: DUF1893 domain-containing protein [Spirochaetaceae bacterium]|nr:MAG: DUF1893 domain-containing protein [Spirochaetaceae bacterium]
MRFTVHTLPGANARCERPAAGGGNAVGKERSPTGSGAAGAAVVLRLSRNGDDLFTSDGLWLHPLLDLTRFIAERGESAADCELYDKIVGRAAALLIVRLCIRTVRTDLLSRRAIPVFDAHGVAWRATTVVDRIDCRTEDLLAEEHDPDAAYRVIRARALAAQVASDPACRALAVQGVSVVRGEQTVLRDVNLMVGRGEKVLITGANGAGKTSLLKTILGTVPPSGGTVHIMRESDRATRIGYVNQESVPVSFPISAREVVAIGVAAVGVSRREKRRRVQHAMETTRCDALADRMYGTLSGGEKQRVAIARCLAQGARVLLLDEPTASLDAEGKRKLVALVERLADEQEITVVMVTHEFDAMDRTGWRHVAIADGALHAVEASR